MPIDEERTLAQACYAATMHLQAHKKTSAIFSVIIGLSIAISAYYHNYWLVLVGFLLCIPAYFFVFKSCVQFVARTIGMPEDMQVFYFQKYKTEPEFAKEIDKFREQLN
jgi:hypothetical protein